MLQDNDDNQEYQIMSIFPRCDITKLPNLYNSLHGLLRACNDYFMPLIDVNPWHLC